MEEGGLKMEGGARGRPAAFHCVIKTPAELQLLLLLCSNTISYQEASASFMPRYSNEACCLGTQ